MIKKDFSAIAPFLSIRHAIIKIWQAIRHPSIALRLVLLNIIGPLIFVLGVLALSESRQALATAYQENMFIQARMISGALVVTANEQQRRGIFRDSRGFSGRPFIPHLPPRDSEMILKSLVRMSDVRARLYGRDGRLILDSALFADRNEVIRRELSPLEDESSGLIASFWSFWQGLGRVDFSRMPLLSEAEARSGISLKEVRNALAGHEMGLLRRDEQGRDIVTVAVPVQRYRAIAGVLMLTSKPGAIDEIIYQERMAIIELFLIALGVSLFISILLARAIARPLRRLGQATQNFHKTIGQLPGAETIPDYSTRHDEIGDLSKALREMVGQLLARINMIDHFAADVAHELKNPLTALYSAVQSLQQAKTAKERKELIDIIEQGVHRLNRLISDISNATRLDAELSRDIMQPFHMNAFIDEIGHLMADLHDHITLEIHDDTDKEIMYHGQKQRIGQIVENLISNAVSFSPLRGRVTLRLQADIKSIQISVTDEGQGLITGTEEKVFERFYTDRPHNTQKNPQQITHSGLGLSIARQIAHAHGGTLTAINRPDRSGACFTLHLPIM